MCRIVAVYSELGPFQADVLERAPADSPTAGRTDSERCTLGHIDRFTPALGRAPLPPQPRRLSAYSRPVPPLFSPCFRTFLWWEGCPLLTNGAHRGRGRTACGRAAEIEPNPQGSRGGPMGSHLLVSASRVSSALRSGAAR